MPARIDAATELRIQETAKNDFQSVGLLRFCTGRYVSDSAGEIVFNEVNTIPGFTSHSRYPNMMKGIGLSFSDMLDKLLGLYTKRMRKITLSNNKIYDGNLILVNAAYSLQSTRENELVSANTDYPDILLCRDAASALQMVLEKISAARDIVPVSGYRSQWEQTQIYNDSLKRKRSGIYKEICCNRRAIVSIRQEWRLIWGYIRITLISSVLIFPMTVFAKCSVKRHRAMALLSAIRQGKKRLRESHTNLGTSVMLVFRTRQLWRTKTSHLRNMLSLLKTAHRSTHRLMATSKYTIFHLAKNQQKFTCRKRRYIKFPVIM